MTNTLEVKGLRTHFFMRGGVVKAVDGVDFSIRKGEIMGLVGESGSGKSITGFSIIGLIDPPGEIIGGSIKFNGEEIANASEERLQKIRGDRIAMVFQDPMMTLNPVLRIDTQMIEAIEAHRSVSKQEAWTRARDTLGMVGIPSPDERMRAYPHQLSGGMRQRAMIAMALSCNPKVLIADEPTTALDVTIQAQILDLMREIQETTGAGIIFITHDMGVIAENADRVVVMYAGRKVEETTADELFDCPGHPYTRGLLDSLPNLEAAAHTGRTRLNEIKGMVPSLHNLPQGCTFAPRCRHATSECQTNYPPLDEHRPGHWVACWHADKLLGAGA